MDGACGRGDACEQCLSATGVCLLDKRELLAVTATCHTHTSPASILRFSRVTAHVLLRLATRSFHHVLTVHVLTEQIYRC